MNSLNKKVFEEMSLVMFSKRYLAPYELNAFEMSQSNIDLERWTDSLESQGIQYFHVSFNPEDILEAFEAEPQVSIDDYELIQLEEGPCIAIPR